ncbi:MAG: hydrogenase expression/formation protein HypE [Gemmatimonadetes bacterium]|nr:hydrogenase expression/formation protein HypE [Gemmatimonadota bacterium]
MSAPRRDRIGLAHGGGGQLTDELLDAFVRPVLTNPWLDTREDSAVLEWGGDRIAFTTDSFVVQPLEFPGGDIGRLAVSGTVNDLAVAGARPEALSLALVIEEGLELDVVRRVLASVAATAQEAGVPVVTGDTKVVGRGQADRLFINTTGMGRVAPGVDLGVHRVQPGDRVLVSGTVADHGLAVMLQREGAFGMESTLESDAAPLNGLVQGLLDACGGDVVFLRDPTRGGLAGVVADLAQESGLRVVLDEVTIPIRPETLYAAEILGLDPLDVANEGKVVVVVRPDRAADALAALQAHPYGREARVIGRVGEEEDGLCELVTDVGGRRILQKPYGEELPRIC